MSGIPAYSAILAYTAIPADPVPCHSNLPRASARGPCNAGRPHYDSYDIFTSGFVNSGGLRNSSGGITVAGAQG
jgi:hypothetical protein